MEKVIYSYKDLGLASYLIVNGNEFKGIKLKFSKRFNEFKVYVDIEGTKDNLLAMKDYYEENKFSLLKTKSVNDQLSKIVKLIEMKEV